MRGDLSAELAADRSSAACDQHDFIIYKVKDLFHIRLDGLTAQKILDGYLLHLADSDLSAHELVHARQISQLTVRLLADFQNIAALLCCRTRNSQIDLVDLILLYAFQNVIPASHNRDTVDITAPFVGIIVNKTTYLVTDLSRPAHIPRDHLPGIAGSDDHHISARLGVLVLTSKEQDKTVGKANPYHKNKLHDCADYIIGNRHALKEQRDRCRVEDTCDHRCLDHIQKLRVTCKSPDALVQLRFPENNQTKNRINRCKLAPRAEIGTINAREFAIIAEPKWNGV